MIFHIVRAVAWIRQNKGVMIRLLLFSVLAGLICEPAQAGDIYKWVDKDGKVHYGDAGEEKSKGDDTSANKAENSSGNKQKGKKPTELNDQSWNRAVDKLENTPTGSVGRHLGEPSSPGSSDYVRPRSYSPPSPSYNYNQSPGPNPSDALRQREAEKLRYDQRKRAEEAREQQRQKLIAECEKQRYTDCKDEKTLRYIQNLDRQRIGR